MPNWKKVVTSGSNAQLNHVTASGGIVSPGTITGGQIVSTGRIFGGLAAGTDNSVVVLSSGQLVTDEIRSEVWGSDALLTTTTIEEVTIPNATLASRASTVAVAADGGNAEHPVLFVDSATGNLAPKTDPGIMYNPSGNKLTLTGAISASGGFVGHQVIIGMASGFINRTAAQFASDGTDQVYIGSNNYGWNDARDWATQLVDTGTPVLNQNDQMCGIICPVDVTQVTLRSQVRMNAANGTIVTKVYKMDRATAVATSNLALTEIGTASTSTLNGRFTTIDIVGTTSVAAGQLIIVGFGKSDGGTGQKPRFNFTVTGTTA